MTSHVCSVTTCNHPVQARGWCNTHYWRWWKFGDPQEDKPTRLPIRENFFDKWSNEMAWLLGLIAADGCVSGYTNKRGNCQAQIAIVSKDKDLIETVRGLLQSGHILGFADSTKYHPDIPGSVYRLDFRNDHIAKKLIQHGIRERKSYCGFDVIVPAKYARHYIRGFFDGDGCVSARNDSRATQRYWSLACSDKDAIVKMSAMISSGARVQKKQYIYARGLYRISWGAAQDMQRIYTWLYGRNGPCLSRKRDRFEDILKRAGLI